METIIKNTMKSIHRTFIASILVLIIPFAFAAGQEKKNEQRIKIVIAEDNGSKVVLDTLITGNTENDSIVLNNGNTIYLAKEGNDSGGFNSEKTKYVINRDGVVITVEGSDYARVKEIIKEIEKTLNTQKQVK
jgi:hypothetical protein